MMDELKAVSVYWLTVFTPCKCHYCLKEMEQRIYVAEFMYKSNTVYEVNLCYNCYEDKILNKSLKELKTVIPLLLMKGIKLHKDKCDNVNTMEGYEYVVSK